MAPKTDLEIHASDELRHSLGASDEELRFLLVAKLVELGRLSIGRGSEICGESRAAFMQHLGSVGVPVINVPDDQIEEEFRDS